jgi:hypothetical protein
MEELTPKTFTAEAFLPLDEEEQTLLASLETDAWQPVPNQAEAIVEAVNVARHTINMGKITPAVPEAQPNLGDGVSR